MTNCPSCHEPMIEYPTLGWRQCPSCGLVQDYKQGKPCESLPLDVMIEQAPAAWRVALTADPTGRVARETEQP